MDEGLIQVQAMAARIACLRMTAQRLKALHDSVEHACCLPARSQWDRKAAAKKSTDRMALPKTCSSAGWAEVRRVPSARSAVESGAAGFRSRADGAPPTAVLRDERKAARLHTKPTYPITGISAGAKEVDSGGPRWGRGGPAAGASDIGAPAEEARALEGIGHCSLLLHDGNPGEAATHVRQALAIYERIGAPSRLARPRSPPPPPHQDSTAASKRRKPPAGATCSQA
ncbi:MAG TPA: hypothetical protein VGA04_28415 [Streptosporangiaceae bacterium]